MLRVSTRSIASSISLRFPEKCWKCGSSSFKVQSCKNQKCGALQPLAPGTTFFDVLLGDLTGEISAKSIEPYFDLKASKLKENYRRLQQMVHPDAYTLREEKEKQISEQQSTFINRAYETLKSPLKRAIYILELYGHGITEKDKTSDTKFTLWVFEQMEAIDEAESIKKILKIELENSSKFKITLESYSETLQKLNAAFNSKDFNLAKTLTIKLKYLSSIQSSIESKKEELQGF